MVSTYFVVEHLFQGQGQGHAADRDRGRARPAVGLEDVAIDDDGRLAERGQIGHAPERTADEPLDLVGPARDLSRRPLPGRPLLRGAGKHGVFGGHPARSRVLEERRDLLVDRGRRGDLGLPHLDVGGAVGVVEIIRPDEDGAESRPRARFPALAAARSLQADLVFDGHVHPSGLERQRS